MDASLKCLLYRDVIEKWRLHKVGDSVRGKQTLYVKAGEQSIPRGINRAGISRSTEPRWHAPLSRESEAQVLLHRFAGYLLPTTGILAQ